MTLEQYFTTIKSSRTLKINRYIGNKTLYLIIYRTKIVLVIEFNTEINLVISEAKSNIFKTSVLDSQIGIC